MTPVLPDPADPPATRSGLNKLANAMLEVSTTVGNGRDRLNAYAIHIFFLWIAIAIVVAIVLIF